MSTVAMMVAMTPSGIIGVNGGMPWHYPADMRRFKSLTMGHVVIMGRRTWESLPKGLPGRRCMVLTRQGVAASGADCECYGGVDAALLSSFSDQHGEWKDPIWIIGGEETYREMGFAADVLDVTIVPEIEVPEGAHVSRFPVEVLEQFVLVCEERDGEDPRLTHHHYRKPNC